jgi:predicted nucleic acid-binding protein
VTALLDTSVIVRYLTLDPPDQGARARELIDGELRLTIPTVAIAEASYVLMRFYGIAREHVVDVLTELITRESIVTLELPKPLVIEALELCRPSGRVSVTDALIWASARAADENSAVYTFDRRFPDSRVDRRVIR